MLKDMVKGIAQFVLVSCVLTFVIFIFIPFLGIGAIFEALNKRVKS